MFRDLDSVWARRDFRPTPDGWRISEVNSDVPGGFTESSRFTEMIADLCGSGEVVGEAGAAWIVAPGPTRLPHPLFRFAADIGARLVEHGPMRALLEAVVASASGSAPSEEPCG